MVLSFSFSETLFKFARLPIGELKGFVGKDLGNERFIISNIRMLGAFLSLIRYLSTFPVIVILYFSYFSSKQYIPDDVKSNFQTEKYKKSLLEGRVIERKYIKLLEFVKKDKPYLDCDLNLNKLAELLGVSKHNLSQVINIKTGQNFYSFINSYRVEEFKISVTGNRFPNFTHIAITMECGFSSSSSFYSVFKKITGVTPKEFVSTL